MQQVTLNTSTVSIAEEWNELTKNQLLKIINLLFDKDLVMSMSNWRYGVLFQLLKIKFYNLRFLWLFMNLPKSDIVIALFPLMAWVEKKNTLTDFKIKSFTIKGVKYYPPEDGLINLTLDEFSSLEPLYTKYQKTKDVDYLDGLVGILYRKKRKKYNPHSLAYKGDIREDFNEHLIPYLSEAAEELPLREKQLIYLTYEGGRNKIIANCPHLFTSSEDKKQAKDFGFGGLILELSGNKFGDFEKTKQTNIITSFNFLEMEAIKLKQQKVK
jgi:hypothetical protein